MVTTFSNETAASLAQSIDYAYTFAAGAVPRKYPPPFPIGIPTGYTSGALAQAVDDFVIEGHSLGGGIVSMLALTLCYAIAAVTNAATVYTFASPALGDGDFATAYEGNAPQKFCIWNPWDLVLSAPPSFLGYSQLVNAGIKLAPTISQLEQYDFLSVDCNHSLRSYQWLLDGQYPLLMGRRGAALPIDRPARLQAAVADMRVRQIAGP
jgi:pimeloyl-ACP methyl ester carboxylesterase